MLLFLDANVLFSAAYLDKSKPLALFRLAQGDWCELITSPYAIEEARRNLARKRVARLPELERLVCALTVCSEPARDNIEWGLSLGLNLKDAPILGAAVQVGAQVLVTGDKSDFGDLDGRRLRGVEILTPAAALDRILKGAGV